MSKQAVSVTLDRDNLVWLRARMRAHRRRSLSDTLDGVVTEARARQSEEAGTKRSVVGTISIAGSDPDLTGADAAMRSVFAGTGEREGRAAPRRRRRA